MAKQHVTDLAYGKLHDVWAELSSDERLQRFKSLPLSEAEEFFRELSTRNQLELVSALPEGEQRVWIRLLDPDDAADLVQEAPQGDRQRLLQLLDQHTRDDVAGLLAYAEDVAGGLMSPRYARVRPEMTVSEALTYLRKQALEQTETVYSIYVLSPDQKLLGVTSLRKLFSSEPSSPIKDFMRTNVITAGDQADQEELSRLFAEHDLIAIPVVDDQDRMKG